MMGWAKYEEDNREAWTERNANRSCFWTSCVGQTSCRSSAYNVVSTGLAQAKHAPEKKKSYVYDC